MSSSNLNYIVTNGAFPLLCSAVADVFQVQTSGTHTHTGIQAPSNHTYRHTHTNKTDTHTPTPSIPFNTLTQCAAATNRITALYTYAHGMRAARTPSEMMCAIPAGHPLLASTPPPDPHPHPHPHTHTEAYHDTSRPQRTERACTTLTARLMSVCVCVLEKTGGGACGLSF